MLTMHRSWSQVLLPLTWYTYFHGVNEETNFVCGAAYVDAQKPFYKY